MERLYDQRNINSINKESIEVDLNSMILQEEKFDDWILAKNKKRTRNS